MRIRVFLALTLAAGCSFTREDGAAGDAPRAPDAPATIVPDAGCPDDDGDGVCNDVDRCPGSDDRLDGDQDGIPDGCDTWKCGAAKPSDPGLGGIVAINPAPSNVSFATLGQGPVAMVTAGQELELSYSYGVQLLCPGASATCRVQIEYGIGTTRFGCLFDGNVATTVFQGDLNKKVTFDAPSTPGVYLVRAKLVTSQGCGGSPMFTNGAPPDQQAIAILCVPP
ncbi:MAG: hypothetical protein KF773_15850 [Deltaproteobacteria bacterium]|nr:hypothetical protein [Deltaproteobacteria bacterium]